MKRRKFQVNGSQKGCMRGKGGPDNPNCVYRGVRQSTWGKWVAEIQELTIGTGLGQNPRSLWLGTFSSAFEAAIAYDEAARTMYGPTAILNCPGYFDKPNLDTKLSNKYPNVTQNSTPELEKEQIGLVKDSEHADDTSIEEPSVKDEKIHINPLGDTSIDKYEVTQDETGYCKHSVQEGTYDVETLEETESGLRQSVEDNQMNDLQYKDQLQDLEKFLMEESFDNEPSGAFGQDNNNNSTQFDLLNFELSPDIRSSSLNDILDQMEGWEYFR